ncbi:MAG: hypothetical protein NTW29_19315 [Bacteroidetes bacterium]|nr:hypothetical protein [Bacteroidota bacterium]
MKKVIQAASLILIAAFAVLAAASSYPSREAKRLHRSEKKKVADSTDFSGCSHNPDMFIYETNITSVINH